MNRTHIKWLPILLAGLFFAYQYFTSEKFVNPETGRKSHVGMSVEQESALGFQSYRQVLSQSETINSGPELEMVKRVAGRLAAATGQAGSHFDWKVSLIRDQKVNAFCLPGGKLSSTPESFPSRKTKRRWPRCSAMKWRTPLRGTERSACFNKISRRPLSPVSRYHSRIWITINSAW